MTDKNKVPSEARGDGAADEDIPALFATIHFKSDRRLDGYTDEEIAELNRIANFRAPEIRK